MAPGVGGSSPLSHPVRSVAQLVEHWSPKPAVGGSSPSRPAFLKTEGCSSKGFVSAEGAARASVARLHIGLSRAQASDYAAGNCLRQLPAAVSSRGPGRSPLKAQTRVRIPLPLLKCRPVRLSVRTAPFHGAERGSIPLRATWGRDRRKWWCLVRLSKEYEGGASAKRERLQID